MALREEVLALRSQGNSYNEIVRALGCSKSIVSYYCGDGKQKENMLTRQRDKRNQFKKRAQEIKSETPCMDCGVNYPYYVMEFDHRPGEGKLFNISKSASIPTREVFEAELAKCDVVCANCHRVRTWSRALVTGNSTLPS